MRRHFPSPEVVHNSAAEYYAGLLALEVEQAYELTAPKSLYETHEKLAGIALRGLPDQDAETTPIITEANRHIEAINERYAVVLAEQRALANPLDVMPFMVEGLFTALNPKKPTGKIRSLSLQAVHPDHLPNRPAVTAPNATRFGEVLQDYQTAFLITGGTTNTLARLVAASISVRASIVRNESDEPEVSFYGKVGKVEPEVRLAISYQAVAGMPRIGVNTITAGRVY